MLHLCNPSLTFPAAPVTRMLFLTRRPHTRPLTDALCSCTHHLCLSIRCPIAIVADPPPSLSRTPDPKPFHWHPSCSALSAHTPTRLLCYAKTELQHPGSSWVGLEAHRQLTGGMQVCLKHELQGALSCRLLACCCSLEPCSWWPRYLQMKARAALPVLGAIMVRPSRRGACGRDEATRPAAGCRQGSKQV